MTRPRFHAAFALFVVLALSAAALADESARRTTWFLAEGATGPFDEQILIGNPNAIDAAVTITYLRYGGAAPVEQHLIVRATGRATVRVGDVPGLASALDVSAVVTCTNGLDIVVERSMYWRSTTHRAGHNATGVTGAATRWFLAEGATGAFDEFVLVANPGASPATVRVTYLRPLAAPLAEPPLVLPPNSRFTIWVNYARSETARAELSTLVESDVPVVVERAMYFPARDATHTEWVGGTGSAGIVSANRTWLLAEGFAGNAPGGGRFDTFVLLANPAPTPTSATVTFFTDGGTTLVRPYDLPANSRTTIWANEIASPDGAHPLAGAAFSTRVDATAPIVVERAMYWGDAAGWSDGHDAVGLTAPALAWAFAEGLQGRPAAGDLNHDSYFLVLNETASPLVVRATLVREDGTGVVRDYGIAAHARFTIASSEFPELTNQRFATFLESTNGVPFAAERSVYWGPTYEGGHASPGVPWSGIVATPPDPPPAILGVSPSLGSSLGGTRVEITGYGFGADATVRVDGAPASSVHVVSPTRLTAVTPAGARGAAVSVSVTTRGETATSAAAFTYTGSGAPQADVAAPASGPSDGGTTVEIRGSELSAPVTVSVGGVQVAASAAADGRTVRVVMPPHAPGAVDITITTATGTATLAAPFVYYSTELPARILAFGDSVTQGLTAGTAGDGGYPIRLEARLADAYPSLAIEVDNAGVSGECVSAAGCNGVPTAGVTRYETVVEPDHDLVVVLDGVNDLSSGIAASEALAAVRTVVTNAQVAGRRVVLVSLIPGRAEPAGLHAIEAFNTSLEALAAERGVPYVDVYTPLAADPSLMSSDDLHPTADGYDVIAELVFDAIVSNFGRLP